MIDISCETPSLDVMLNELERAIRIEPTADLMIKYQELYEQKYERVSQ